MRESYYNVKKNRGFNHYGSCARSQGDQVGDLEIYHQAISASSQRIRIVTVRLRGKSPARCTSHNSGDHDARLSYIVELAQYRNSGKSRRLFSGESLGASKVPLVVRFAAQLIDPECSVIWKPYKQ